MVSTRRSPHSRLSLNGLVLQLSIGNSDEERQIPQPIRFDIQIQFPSFPQGCVSDHLVDTVCYDQLSQRLRQVCQEKPHRLIEKLGWECFQALAALLPPQASLTLSITKERPPIDGLNQGATFTLSDDELAAVR